MYKEFKEYLQNSKIEIKTLSADDDLSKIFEYRNKKLTELIEIFKEKTKEKTLLDSLHILKELDFVFNEFQFMLWLRTGCTPTYNYFKTQIK